MIRTKSIEDQLRTGRLDAKTLDSMFRRRIEEGANCSPFVSKAILAAVKDVYPIGPDEPDHQLGLGPGPARTLSKRGNLDSCAPSHLFVYRSPCSFIADSARRGNHGAQSAYRFG